MLDNACKVLGLIPDLLVSSKEERRITWFDGFEGDISELYIPKTVEISATQMRLWLVYGDFERWKAYSPVRLRKRFESLRRAVAEAEGNDVTESV